MGPVGALRFRSAVLLSLLPAVVAVAVYRDTLRYGFIWDDDIVLKHQLQALKTVWDVFFPPAGIAQLGYEYYRPLVFFTYFLDRALGGGSPFWFHLSVVLTHALNSLLLFVAAARLFRELPGRHVGALTAAVLFAAHPIHTESVAWMAGRSDVLACLFVLASLVCYLRHRLRSTMSPLLLSAFFCLCALLTKETAIALPFLLLALDVLRVEGRSRPGLAVAGTRCGLFLGVVTVYFLLRLMAVGKVVGGGDPEAPLLRQAESVVLALGFYIEKVLLPIDLNLFVADLPAGAFFLGFSLLAVGGSVFFFLRWWRGGQTIASFLLAWFFVTLIPPLVTAIGPIAPTPVAERYLYIPSVGFVMLLAYAALRLVQRARSTGHGRVAEMGAGLFIAVLLAFYTAGTVQRNRVWASDVSLWRDAAAKTPNHGLPHLQLGLAYEKRGMVAEAEREYRSASVGQYHARGRSLAYSNLGRLVILSGREEEGEGYLRQALEIDPGHVAPYLHLAAFAFDLAIGTQKGGQRAETDLLARRARELLEHAVRLDPYSVRAHALLGQVAFFMGDKEATRRHLREAIRLDPLSAQAREARELLATLQ